jgi:hypothetical protein
MPVLHVAPKICSSHLLLAHDTPCRPLRLLVHLLHVPPKIRLAGI